MRLHLMVMAAALAAAMLPLNAAGAVEASDPPNFVKVNVPGAFDVVTDEATQQVFVSRPGYDAVDVYDWSGKLIETLAGIDYGFTMALDATSGTVYVTELASSKIAAIDTDTLDVTHYATTGTTCPYSVSALDGKVYYSYWGDACEGSGAIGVLDPSDASPQGVHYVGSGMHQPVVAAMDGIIVTAEGGTDTANVRSYSVTDAGAVLLAAPETTAQNAHEIAISPGGDEVVVAAGFPYEHVARDPQTLDTLYAYKTSRYPNAAAFSPDGSVFAAGSDWTTGVDVRLFKRGQTVPFLSLALGGPNVSDQMRDGGLALGDSTHLFALSRDGGSQFLYVYEFQARSPSAITIDVPDSGTVGDIIPITGELSGYGEQGFEPLPGEEVSIRGYELGAEVELGTALVDENGLFELEVPLTAGGITSLLARWPGNETYTAAVSDDVIDISRLPSTLSVSRDADAYIAGSDATVTITLGHDDQSTGSVKLSAVDAKGTHELATGSFDAAGRFETTVPVARSGYFVAEYAGSSAREPASASSEVFDVEAAVTATVDGSFRRSGGVWFVRPGVDPKVTWTVDPGPIATDCAETVLQRQTAAGSWRMLQRAGCRDADHRHWLSWLLKDERTDGTKWRVRLISDATSTHLPIRSDWTYIRFSR